MLGGAALAIFLFIVGSSAAVYAQTESAAGGQFSAANAGFEMQFPDGWNNNSISETYAIVSPLSAAGTVMTVLVVDRPDTRKLITSEIGVNSDRVVIYEDDQCTSPINEFATMNGVRVFRTVHECSGETYSKTETYVIFTLTKSIAVSLSATSEQAYDRHVGEFERALETIIIDEPVDFRNALEVILGATNIFSQDIEVDSVNSQVKLTAATSSQISDIVLDEASRSISITVEEQRRAEGHLLIPAHRLLVGPYQVYVDGEASDDFLVIGDENGTTQLIDVMYGKGRHEIEITGTQVVPEFGTGMAGALAATIVAVFLYRQRTAGQDRTPYRRLFERQWRMGWRGVFNGKRKHERP